MRITVKLHSTLRKFLPAGVTNAVVLDVHDGARVNDVIARLGIPPGHAKIIVSGNEQLEPTAALRDGQELNLFPPIAGGC